MSTTTAYGDSAKATPTAPAQQGGGGGGSRLAWALADSWTMTRRELAHWAGSRSRWSWAWPSR